MVVIDSIAPLKIFRIKQRAAPLMTGEILHLIREIGLFQNSEIPKTSVGTGNVSIFGIRFNIRRNRPNQTLLQLRLMNSNNNLNNYGNC